MLAGHISDLDARNRASVGVDAGGVSGSADLSSPCLFREHNGLFLPREAVAHDLRLQTLLGSRVLLKVFVDRVNLMVRAT
mmetsp:Transcript_8968/g.12239  ORF Transcript_8968/g.12239 Transcript_8968/m.12239 type:complete len:80 (+) Transcript_8968:180-419(+)